MACDVCQMKTKGYTVFFSERNEFEIAKNYFQEKLMEDYSLINTSTMWLIETLFFSFIDYAMSHLDVNNITAVETDVLFPLKNVGEKKLISLFHEERNSSWIDDLINENRIVTHYQPIVEVKSGRIQVFGHELLSRGLDNEGKIIPPKKMFDAARQRNRLFSLDRACRLQSVRNASILKEGLIFINFLPTAIYEPRHCLASTFSLIKELDISPEQIVFEVVETDEVKDILHLKKILAYYRSHGFKYALDDVGVGFNDITKLEAVAPDFVKLAIEYTNGISKDFIKQRMAESVLRAAQRIGSITLAEGVENEEDFLYLQEMGFDLYQGYYFSRPLSRPLSQKEIESNIKTT